MLAQAETLAHAKLAQMEDVEEDDHDHGNEHGPGASRSRRHAGTALQHALAHFEAHHEALQDIATNLRLAGNIAVTATCTFYDDTGNPTGEKSGPVSPAGDVIGMDLPWNRFTGPMTGLWQGPDAGANDFYIMSHNVTTGALAVWCVWPRTPPV
jgi:hypothetical protein